MARKGFPLIDGYFVDLKALQSVAHACDPSLCAGSCFCCAHYEIHMSSEEINRIVSYAPFAAKYSTSISDEDEIDNMFDSEDEKVFIMDADEQNGCVFSFESFSGEGRFCSLHAAALDLKHDPYKVKPACCTLWPLALAGEKENVLSIQDDVFDFPCNKKRESGIGGLHNGVEEILTSLFGASFLVKVKDALSVF